LFQQIICSVIYSNLEHSPPPGESADRTKQKQPQSMILQRKEMW